MTNKNKYDCCCRGLVGTIRGMSQGCFLLNFFLYCRLLLSACRSWSACRHPRTNTRHPDAPLTPSTMIAPVQRYIFAFPPEPLLSAFIWRPSTSMLRSKATLKASEVGNVPPFAMLLTWMDAGAGELPAEVDMMSRR